MKTIEETRACARSLTEHDCAGPATVFTNADGRKCIHEQCMFCLRRSSQALKPCQTFGQAIEDTGSWVMDLPLKHLVARWDRIFAYAALREGKWPPTRYQSMGDNDPLDAYSLHVRRAYYKARLAEPRWQLLRKRIIERAGGRCELCGAPGPLDGHHLTYVRLGRERPEDVAAVCRRCHETKIHDRSFGELRSAP